MTAKAIAPSCSDAPREITESANCCSADRMPLTTYASAELASEIVGSVAMGELLDASEMACCSCACACTTLGLDSTLSSSWRWAAVAAVSNSFRSPCCWACASVSPTAGPARTAPG